jgi:hypothetical protein
VGELRHFALRSGALALSIPLGQGGSYRHTSDDPQTLAALAQACDDDLVATVVPPDGGLLSGLSAGANLALALSNGITPAQAGPLDQALSEALQQAGMAIERVAALHRLLPADLNPLERWTLGWVVPYLRGAQLLVLDRPFMPMNHAQQCQVVALEALFRTRHPRTPVVWLQLSEPIPMPTPALGAQPQERVCLC